MLIRLLKDYTTRKGMPYKAEDVIDMDFGTSKKLISEGIAQPYKQPLETKVENVKEQPSKSNKNSRRSNRASDSNGSEGLSED